METPETDPTPTRMTTLEAVQLIRNGKPDQLTPETSTQLRELLERNPSLHVLVGDEETVRNFARELEKSCTPPPAASASTSEPRGARVARPIPRVPIGAASLLVLFAVTWGVAQNPVPELVVESNAAAAHPEEPLPVPPPKQTTGSRVPSKVVPAGSPAGSGSAAAHRPPLVPLPPPDLNRKNPAQPRSRRVMPQR